MKLYKNKTGWAFLRPGYEFKYNGQTFRISCEGGRHGICGIINKYAVREVTAGAEGAPMYYKAHNYHEAAKKHITAFILQQD